MQIVVTFNNFEEMETFAQKLLEKKKPFTAAELTEMSKDTTEIINRAEAREEAEKKAEKATKKAEAKKQPKAEEEPADKPDTTSEEPSEEVSDTDVKILLSEKLKAGKKAEVKELFGKYGVEKLSELIEKHPDKLTEFYKDAEGI